MSNENLADPFVFPDLPAPTKWNNEEGTDDMQIVPTNDELSLLYSQREVANLKFELGLCLHQRNCMVSTAREMHISTLRP
jgi:hypothetical protein